MPGPPRQPLSPPRILALGMAGVIVAGTLLLLLPISSATGQSIGLLRAVFTSTSAVCVTGLIVIDTPSALSGFGQSILLLLIQIGGLGYMTLSTLVAIALGRRVGLHTRFSLQESLNLSSRRELLQFTATVFKKPPGWGARSRYPELGSGNDHRRRFSTAWANTP